MPTCVQCGFDNVETVRVCDLCDEPVPRTAAAVIGTVSRTTSALAAPPPFMLLKKLQDDVRILLQRTQEQERPPQLQGRPPPAGGALSQEAKRRAVRPPHSGLAQTGGAMPSLANMRRPARPRDRGRSRSSAQRSKEYLLACSCTSFSASFDANWNLFR